MKVGKRGLRGRILLLERKMISHGRDGFGGNRWDRDMKWALRTREISRHRIVHYHPSNGSISGHVYT